MTSGDSEQQKEMRQVGDIMIPLSDYPHLPVWSTMLEAIEKMDRSELEVRGRRSLPRVLLLFDLDGEQDLRGAGVGRQDRHVAVQLDVDDAGQGRCVLAVSLHGADEGLALLGLVGVR